MRGVRIAVATALVVLVAACGGTDGPAQSVTGAPVTTSAIENQPATTTPVTTTPATTTPIRGGDCPEVIGAEFVETAPGVFTVSATVRSVDIADVSFADAWEVRDMAGTVLGTRILTHPHTNEQPFTRSLAAVAIPREVTEVEIAARDSVRGFCGVSLTVGVPHS